MFAQWSTFLFTCITAFKYIRIVEKHLNTNKLSLQFCRAVEGLDGNSMSQITGLKFFSPFCLLHICKFFFVFTEGTRISVKLPRTEAQNTSNLSTTIF